MRILWLIVLVVLFLGAAVISAVAFIDNETAVSLRFLQWQTPVISIYWWLLLSLFVGFLLGNLVSYTGSFKIRLSERKARRELVNTEQELQRLKDLSLRE